MLYNLTPKIRRDLKKVIRIQYPRAIASSIRFSRGVISARFREGGARVPLTTYSIERGELVTDRGTEKLLQDLALLREVGRGPENYAFAWAYAVTPLPLP